MARVNILNACYISAQTRNNKSLQVLDMRYFWKKSPVFQ